MFMKKRVLFFYKKNEKEVIPGVSEKMPLNFNFWCKLF